MRPSALASSSASAARKSKSKRRQSWRKRAEACGGSNSKPGRVGMAVTRASAGTGASASRTVSRMSVRGPNWAWASARTASAANSLSM